MYVVPVMSAHPLKTFSRGRSPAQHGIWWLICVVFISLDTAWEKIPVSHLAKKAIWRVESERYSLVSESMFELGLQLPNYYGDGVDPQRMSYNVIERLRGEAWEKFLGLDMFFVKVG